MKFSMRCVALAATSVALVPQLYAQDAYTPRSCGCLEPGAEKYEQLGDVFAIDAVSGKQSSSADQFDRRADVTILLNNENPYRFEYTLTHKSENVESKTIKAALKALGMLEGAEKASDEAKEDKRKADAAEINALQRELMENIEVCKIKTDVEDALTKAESAATSANEQLDKIKVDADALLASSGSCSQMCTSSNNVARHRGLISERIGDIAAARSKISENWGSWKLQCLEFVDTQEGLKEKRLASLNKSEKALEAYGPLVDEVDDLLDDPDPFHTIRQAGVSRSPELHTVTVVRTGTREGDKKGSQDSWTYSFETGYNRFSYSVGIGISFIEQQEFEAGTVNVGDSGDDPGKLVRISDTTSEQIGIVAQLNGELVRFPRLGGASILWSVGASLTNGTDDVNFGFYAGPTLGLIDNRLLVTAGYHILRIEEPAPGFEVGATLPPDFSGDVPTSSKTEAGALLAFTWRF